MKLIKLIFASLLVAVGAAKAATVTLAPGFGTGIIVTTNGANTPYTVTIGGFEGGVFTQFGLVGEATATNSFAAGVKLGGAYASAGPESLNNDRVFVRIDIGGGKFGIFQTTGASPTGFFPSDVTAALQSSQANVNNTSQLVVSSFGGADLQSVGFSNANNINFVVVPEPSVALLGALGVLGLIRRRR